MWAQTEALPVLHELRMEGLGAYDGGVWVEGCDNCGETGVC